MRWIVSLLVLVGVGAALCAAVLVGSVRARSLNVPTVEPVTTTEVEILVATRPLPAMTVVDATAVARKLVLSHEVPEGAETSSTRVVGQVLVAPVVEGETFTAAHFAHGETSLELVATLPEGRRAMSTFLPADSGITDLLYPGCVVDVIGSFRMPPKAGAPSGEVLSSTLIQGVQVLAVGPRTIVAPEKTEGFGGPDRKQQRMVTLMVDSRQGEILQLATAHGEVMLALRNPLDRQRTAEPGTLLSGLSDGLQFDDGHAAAALVPRIFGDEAPVRERPAPRGRVWTTNVLRGGDTETVTFPMD